MNASRDVISMLSPSVGASVTRTSMPSNRWRGSGAFSELKQSSNTFRRSTLIDIGVVRPADIMFATNVEMSVSLFAIVSVTGCPSGPLASVGNVNADSSNVLGNRHVVPSSFSSLAISPTCSSCRSEAPDRPALLSSTAKHTPIGCVVCATRRMSGIQSASSGFQSAFG